MIEMKPRMLLAALLLVQSASAWSTPPTFLKGNGVAQRAAQLRKVILYVYMI